MHCFNLIWFPSVCIFLLDKISFTNNGDREGTWNIVVWVYMINYLYLHWLTIYVLLFSFSSYIFFNFVHECTIFVLFLTLSHSHSVPPISLNSHQFTVSPSKLFIIYTYTHIYVHICRHNPLSPINDAHKYMCSGIEISNIQMGISLVCVGGRSNIQIPHFIYLFKGLILQTFKIPAPHISSKERRELKVR